MSSMTKLKAAFLLAPALLLCTSPLSAALRSRSHMRTHAAAHLSSSSRTLAHRAHYGHSRTAHVVKARFHGQQAIDPARTLEIQQALVREHYLTDGEVTGQWDQTTRDALTRLQNDNHWQTKIIPDSRALIKLGLGPSQQNLLNPETAAIAMPGPSDISQDDSSGAN